MTGDLPLFFVSLGVLFLAGQAADHFGRITRLPRVTMLLLIGLFAGQAGFGLIPEVIYGWFDVLSTIALTMVAFLLGSALSTRVIARIGNAVLSLSLAVTIATMVVVPLGLIAFGVDPAQAMILGAIATATDPAAVTDVIRQSGLKTRFTDTLSGIVAIDDGWGLIIFSFVLLAVGPTSGASEMAASLTGELGGAILLGASVGLPAAFLTGRISAGEPLQAEAIGIVFLTAGLALWFEVSFLIAGMTAGGIIVNFARHHERAFHEIENVEWPFLLLFFLLAGASLQPAALLSVGWIGAAYLLLRIASRLIGGVAGARLCNVPHREGLLYGPSLLPQAGLAIGMALVAEEAMPQHADAIMALAIASTVVFELIGPPITLAAIRRNARDESDQP